MWGTEFLQSMHYYLGQRHKIRSAEQINTEILKVKKEAEETIDAAWLDRRAYCLTNVLVNLEREIPVLEAHLESMGTMPDNIKATTDWFMDNTYVKNRLESYKVTLEQGNKELEEIKTKLKEFRFNKDKEELEEELKALDDVDVKNLEGPPEPKDFEYKEG